MPMTTCPACQRDVQKDRKDCPYCGVFFAKWNPHPWKWDPDPVAELRRSSMYPSPSKSLPIIPEAEVVVRRWRKVIWSIAILLPLISLVVVILSLVFDWEQPEVRAKVIRDLPLLIVSYPIMVVFNWPFFLFAWMVGNRVRARWPDVANIHLAILGGLIGPSVIYFIAYAVLAIIGLPLDAQDDDRWKVVSFLVYVCPIGAAQAGLVGWFIGNGMAKFRRASVGTAETTRPGVGMTMNWRLIYLVCLVPFIFSTLFVSVSVLYSIGILGSGVKESESLTPWVWALLVCAYLLPAFIIGVRVQSNIFRHCIAVAVRGWTLGLIGMSVFGSVLLTLTLRYDRGGIRGIMFGAFVLWLVGLITSPVVGLLSLLISRLKKWPSQPAQG